MGPGGHGAAAAAKRWRREPAPRNQLQLKGLVPLPVSSRQCKLYVPIDLMQRFKQYEKQRFKQYEKLSCSAEPSCRMRPALLPALLLPSASAGGPQAGRALPACHRPVLHPADAV